MIIILVLFGAPIVKYFPSNDGVALIIEGEGEVTKDGITSSGNKDNYVKITVVNATSLAPNAFEGLGKLQTINLSDTVSSIGKNCFASCSSLTEFIFPPRVTSIQSYTFIYCVSLKKVYIPKSITYISFSYTFCSCNSLSILEVDRDNKYYSSDKHLRFIQSKDIKTAYCSYCNYTVTFPAHREIIASYCFTAIKVKEILFEQGSNLNTIHENAFYQLDLKKELILPHGLEIISGPLFSSTKVPSISFPNTITNITTDALDGVIDLQSVKLWEGDGGALSESNGVIYISKTTILFIPSTQETLEIPEGITISGSVITTTPSLKKVNVSKNHSEYSSHNGILYTKNGTVLLASPRNLAEALIADSCEVISSSSFRRTNIEKVRCGEHPSIKKIQRISFDGCTNLKSFEFPESLEEIHDYAFQLSSLSGNITLPSNLNVLSGLSFASTKIESINLEKCVKLTSLMVSTFRGCLKLKAAKLPPNIQYIEDSCFALTALTSFTLPNTIKWIGASCFTECADLTEFRFQEGSILKGLNTSVLNSCNLSSIKIPRQVITLMSGCLSSNPFLHQIIFEDSPLLESIEPNTFSGCSSLLSFEIPASVTSISIGAFADTVGLTNLTVIGSNFKAKDDVIYSSEFSRLICCGGGVSSVVVPQTVNEIATQAFKGCTCLESVVFSRGCGITKIEGSTFYGCTKLTEIELPPLIERVNSLAFNGCSALEWIKFARGSRLVELGDGTFQNCFSLRRVDFDYYSGTVKGSQKTTHLLKTIGSMAFERCWSLTSIELPSSVQYVGSSAFKGCSQLSSVSLGSGLMRIGELAFANCSNLTSITVPPNVSEIGVGAFSNCTLLGEFFFCGINVKASEIFDVKNAPKVFVPIEFEGKDLAGVDVIRVLDRDCMLPTNLFSSSHAVNFSAQMLSTALITSEKSED